MQGVIQLQQFMSFITHFKNHGSSVGIVTGYGLDNRGIRIWVLVGSRIWTSPYHQTGSGAHQFSYPMGIGAPGAPGDKEARAWSWQLASN
jgi:hypothetical protein